MLTFWSRLLQYSFPVLSARPRKLLVFKNPYGGTGNALSIFSRVRPIFDIAGITCEEVGKFIYKSLGVSGHFYIVNIVLITEIFGSSRAFPRSEESILRK